MKVIVPLAEGFEEIEFNTIVDILRRAQVEVVTVGLKDGPVEGAHQVKVIPDTSMSEVSIDDFDAVVLPGGSPGYINLGEDERVLKMVQDMDNGGKYVAAICGAPSVLLKARVLEGRKATVYPSGKDQFASGQYVDQKVVVDGKIITSQGPATAMDFALKLVQILAGDDKMKEVKEDVLAECEV